MVPEKEHEKREIHARRNVCMCGVEIESEQNYWHCDRNQKIDLHHEHLLGCPNFWISPLIKSFFINKILILQKKKTNFIRNNIHYTFYEHEMAHSSHRTLLKDVNQ